MKNFIATISCAALVASMITASAANAAVTLVDPIPPAADTSSATFDAMQAQCDADALTSANADSDQEDEWSGVFVEGTIVLDSGPTEQPPLHTIANAIGGIYDATTNPGGTIMPAAGATFTPNAPHIVGVPYRNGGSVNMFGDQQTPGGHWSAAQYDFMGSFKTTYKHNYTCEIWLRKHHAGTTGTGHYIINPDFKAGKSDDAIQKECDAYNKRGERTPLPGYWGKDIGHCKYVPGDTTPDTFDPAVIDHITPLTGSYFVLQDQLNTLRAHESNDPAGFDDPRIYHRQVVICNSPSKNGPKGAPGTWTPQNGYSGGSLNGTTGGPSDYPGAGCNTTWYAGGAIAAAVNNNINQGSSNWVTIPGGYPGI